MIYRPYIRNYKMKYEYRERFIIPLKTKAVFGHRVYIKRTLLQKMMAYMCNLKNKQMDRKPALWNLGKI